MEIEVTFPDGATGTFECEGTITSAWVCRNILEGLTYPLLPFAGDVRTIWDAGANIGATSAFFAHAYPGATVHAFEPASRTRALLTANVAGYPNVEVHPYGLYDVDTELELYEGDESILASVHRRSVNADASERVPLRAAGGVAAALDVPIDLLKVDVEGCEVHVLESLGPERLGQVQVLYVEYDDRAARRRIEDLVRETHELYFGSLLALDQGEVIYVRNDLAEQPEASEHLVELLRARWT